MFSGLSYPSLELTYLLPALSHLLGMLPSGPPGWPHKKLIFLQLILAWCAELTKARHLFWNEAGMPIECPRSQHYFTLSPCSSASSESWLHINLPLLGLVADWQTWNKSERCAVPGGEATTKRIYRRLK